MVYAARRGYFQRSYVKSGYSRKIYFYLYYSVVLPLEPAFKINTVYVGCPHLISVYIQFELVDALRRVRTAEKAPIDTLQILTKIDAVDHQSKMFSGRCLIIVFSLSLYEKHRGQ